MSKLFTLVLTKSGKEVIYMTDTLQKVKARKKRIISQPVEPKTVENPPENYRYCGTSRQEAEDMREEIELHDEVAAHVIQCNGIYYTVYAD